MRILLFLLLVATVIGLICIRVVLLFTEDRRRLSRAVNLLSKGLLPSKLEERLVVEGLDRAAAALVVERALRSLAKPDVARLSPAPRRAATASAQPEHVTTSIPDVVEPPHAPLPSTPHERGVALLYNRRDYPGALEAFTEAIKQDPLYPNAYLGRAVAQRRLGNFEAAVEDERKAEELGGAEKTTWDRLVNRSRHRWHWDFANPDWKQADPLSRKAVLFRTLMIQIYNGGLFQWFANGYDQWIDDVIEAAREVNSPASREVAALLEELSHELASEPRKDAALEGESAEDDEADEASREERDKLFGTISDYEERYHRVESQFCDDVERWLEAAEK
jgi:tetratricopeptide (TPR) repeat protein